MKNLYDNNFEVEMIDKLKLLEVSPPNDLWVGIESTLKEKSRKRNLIISYSIAAASIALLITVGGIYVLRSRVETISVNQQRSEMVKPSINKNVNPIKQISTSKSISKVERIERNIISPLKSEPPSFKSIDTIRNVVLPDLLNSHVNNVVISENNQPTEINIEALLSENVNSKTVVMADLSEKKGKGKWYLSVSGFPEYSFHTAGVFNQTGSQQELGIVSWGGSILIRHSFNKGISIESGIAYNVLGQQVKDIYIVSYDADGMDISNTDGFNNSYGTLEVSNNGDIKAMNLSDLKTLGPQATSINSFNKVEALQRFRYMEIPVFLSKEIKVKGINLDFKIGYSFGFLIKNQLDLKGSNIHLTGKTLGVDNYISSAIASFGFSIPMIKNINLIVEPTFKMGIKSLPNSSTRSFPFSTYVKFGVEVPI